MTIDVRSTAGVGRSSSAHVSHDATLSGPLQPPTPADWRDAMMSTVLGDQAGLAVFDW